jgi:hypothetical protein
MGLTTEVSGFDSLREQEVLSSYRPDRVYRLLIKLHSGYPELCCRVKMAGA